MMMKSKKIKLETDIETSLDFLKYKSPNVEMPKLDAINDHFLRKFRVSLSNYLHLTCTINLTTSKLNLKEWLEDNKFQSCISLLQASGLQSSIYFKFDRALVNGIIDVLTGGTGKSSEDLIDRDITLIELKFMQAVVDLGIHDLNEAWNPVVKINASYVRAEVNPKFAICDHPTTKLYSIKYTIAFAGTLGVFEVIYPYSRLFYLKQILC